MANPITAPGPHRPPTGTRRTLLVLDNCYSLSLIRERRLEHMVTGRDLDGFFEHVWSVHPLVGASPEHAPKRRAGSPTWQQLAPRHTVLEGAVSRFAPLRRVPVLDFVLAQVQLLRELNALMRRERIPIVLANDPFYLGLMGLVLARLNHARFAICVIANYDEAYAMRGALAYPKLLPSYRLQRAVQRFVFSRAELVTAGNENNAGYAVSSGVPPERLRFFNLGDMIEPIHFAEPRPDPSIRQELGLGDRPFCISLSRLAAEKHPEDAVLALAVAKIHQPGVAMVVVGDGPMRPTLEAIATEHGLEGDVIFAGYRDQTWVARALRTANVAVSALTGRALVEAALSGRPVVAYDVDWQSEFVSDGDTGMIVPYRDTQRMGDAIARLVADPALADVLGAAARARALAAIDPVSSMEQKRGYYRMLLDR